MIKVLYVMGKEPVGGVGSMAFNFHSNFSSEIKVDYLVLCPKENTPFNEKVKKLGSEVFLLSELKYKNIVKIVKMMNSFFEDTQYDIVHLHSPILGGICLKSAAKHGIKNRIIHYHTSSYGENILKRWRNRILFATSVKYATHFFACSQMAASMNQVADNITIVKNAIDCKKFGFNEEDRTHLRMQFGLGDKFIIGHIGRFSVEKNQSFLIEIFEKVHRLNKNYVLLIVGEGPLDKELINLVKKKQLTDSVIFTGRRDDVPALLSAMDIFLLPSFFEGMPVCALEAQASGLPCILSDSITQEVKVLDTMEFLSLSKPKEYWAEKILEIKKSDNREDGVKKVEEAGFDIQNVSLQLEKIYIELLEENHVS